MHAQDACYVLESGQVHEIGCTQPPLETRQRRQREPSAAHMLNTCMSVGHVRERSLSGLQPLQRGLKVPILCLKQALLPKAATGPPRMTIRGHECTQ